MPKPNFAFEKRQRDLAKKRKQDAKRKRKLERKNAQTAQEPENAGDAPAADPGET